MFELCLQKSFRASHALVGGDWGAENQPHSHDYKLEWILEAEGLGDHDYIADLLELENILDRALEKFSQQHLNDLPAFANRNPSLELFAQVLWGELFAPLTARGLTGGKVVLWENAQAWAAYRAKL